MIIIDNPKSHQNVHLTHKTNPPTKQKPNTPKMLNEMKRLHTTKPKGPKKKVWSEKR
jgi:hypothetical protein